MRRILLLLLYAVLTGHLHAQVEGYYRYPAIYNNTIIFTSEGDLWKTTTHGGLAQRLTTHHGVEAHAAISPDGSRVAFTAEYEGPEEVYTIPINGGLPTRITYEGERATVVGWRKANEIIYSTRHYSTLPNVQLVIADLATNQHELIPLHQASDGMYDSAYQTLFFTRLPFQGSHTKRYRGGTAQNIWKYRADISEAEPMTGDYAGTSKTPMWWGYRIYFASDRDGTMNLWSMNGKGTGLKQHTFHSGWDVKSPMLQMGKIVYQLGADLHLFDTISGNDNKLKISLLSDFDQTREKWIDKPMQNLSSVHISPKGEKVVLTSRGRVFVAPAKKGRFVEVSRKQGVRYRDAGFIKDGDSLLLLSDASGEQEFWQFPADGRGSGHQLTRDATVLRFEGIPSPGGERFAFTDKDDKLWLHDFAKNTTDLVAAPDFGRPGDTAWSPDGEWLAYTHSATNHNDRIILYSCSDKSKTELTGERVNSYSPAWSPDGKWIYFLSDRHFESSVRSPWGLRQPEPYYANTTKIYVVSLLADQRFPFQAQDELLAEENSADDEQSSGERNKSGKSEDKVVVKIEKEGLRYRLMEVPVEPGSYRDLAVTKKRLVWRELTTSPRSQNLVALDFDDDSHKAEIVAKKITGYELSSDGGKILIQKRNSVYVVKSGATPSKLADHEVDLKNWTFSVQPKEEWRQMFVDAWRLERDYFYDRNMHGVDWEGMLKKHLPLVSRVSDRAELNDLIAQMVGELSALHIFVRGGDLRSGKDEIALASLGARLRRDEAAGGYQVEHIYQSEPDYPERLSPLSRADANIHEGDIILAIDGMPTLSVLNPGMLLKNKVGEQVLLNVKSPSSDTVRATIVRPISARAESGLRYDEWEYTRRLAVEEMGGGDIGYVHMRAMGGRNFSEWVRNFYPVFNRQGLIIDVRHNRGGNIDSWVLEKLMRKAWFYWQGRTGKPYWNMQYAFRGHMIVLCNERTASDGEAFAEGFRRLGLGKVLGTRTWGGEIWLSQRNRLADGGIASAAETGVYGPEGEWLIEGHGVDPDIVVDNLPNATFHGQDAQLDAAVKYLQELIERDPREVPRPPAYPKKNFDYEKQKTSAGGKSTSGRE